MLRQFIKGSFVKIYKTNTNYIMPKIAKLILCILLCLGVGFTASFFTINAIKTWFTTLNKPSFNPPNYLFGPVWTVLYILMGISLYYIITTTHQLKNKALVLFVIQLFLNLWWSLIFFYWHNIGLALVDIILMWASIIACIYIFLRIKPVAAYLFIPYFIWVTFATALNVAIYFLN